MSDTPRTDAEAKRVYDDEKRYEESYDVAVAAWEFARKLERELNAANARTPYQCYWSRRALAAESRLAALTAEKSCRLEVESCRSMNAEVSRR